MTINRKAMVFCLPCQTKFWRLVSTVIELLMVRLKYYLAMGSFMRVILKIINETAQVFIITGMETTMMGNGSKIEGLEEEESFLQMEGN